MASETVSKPRIEVIDVAEAERRIRAGEIDDSLGEWMLQDIERISARLDIGIAESQRKMNELLRSLRSPAG